MQAALSSPRFRLPRFFVAAFAVAASMLLTACPASLNPVALATTPAQRYDAIRLTYDALLTPAQVFVADPAFPIEARRAVQQTAATSGELYETGKRIYGEFVIARAAVAAGQSPQERLDVATRNLETWVSQFERAVNDLALALGRK